jgi:ribosomal protein L11 methyltransferase
MNGLGNSQPLWVGHRLMVVPMDFESTSKSNLIPLRIDPGEAFGSGTHPTTQLCLMALERRLIPGITVVDIGTGTGILAIAAAKLGANDVLALDIDPEAVHVARENSVANGVDKQIRVKQGSLAEVFIDQADREPASLVIVNILAGIVENLFHDGLATTVRPGGLVILSGLLPTQTPGIRACLQWYGLKQLAQAQQDDWVCILAERLRPA